MSTLSGLFVAFCRGDDSQGGQTGASRSSTGLCAPKAAALDVSGAAKISPWGFAFAARSCTLLQGCSQGVRSLGPCSLLLPRHTGAGLLPRLRGALETVAGAGEGVPAP